ncbi:type I-E CRISPR-associated protein Cas7/Cse4/CasC [Pleomorphomonas sp. NRK KF1]|uniref:type I-E CRISPR-associated protein Cas7/Cse4/CasC n=1 Tax=Pleomorphomonas sp. NRK KF1 TaxID=2943000 RepID=UPI002044C677|nr:type I-E CRISPR-associated protein Cas7/Cse4/CasC [Pleomorphomonas sp. NRK KF1]MCM5552386.1 type I-E CRISPR-associated protein Cas7/Cse4/CasC [Pleomorphomonas sp. NRK KF1]
MPLPRFIQIHSLVSYPAVLLNRDDAGLAKRVSYGGSVRTRVSSQCLKRHWRTAEDDWSLRHTGLELSVRSREIFEYEIGPEVAKALPGVDKAALAEVGKALSRAIYGDKADDVRKRQALLLGWPELRFLTQEAIAILKDNPTAEAAATAAEARFKGKDAKANFAAMRESAGTLAAGLEAALFGRMVTSDPNANTDAAIHVAHAFTVHAQESETDYFTVVDDLKNRDPDEDSGSAGIFDTELTSGLFYEYVVIDVPLLVSNITGVRPEGWAGSDVDRALPAKVAEHLLHLIATISPGAKKGSTAPYARASTLLVEAGSAQPRSLAKAFEKPVQARIGQSQGTLAELALFDALKRFDGIYGKSETRAYASFDGAAFSALADGPQSLDALGGWLNGVISRAEA